MNAKDILHYGHLTFLGELDALPIETWATGGVCGVWSAKDIIAHLASYELVLEDVMRSLVDGDPTPTPTLDRFRDPAGGFNDAEVAARDNQTADEVLNEYVAAHGRVIDALDRIPDETRSRPGTIPWYGAEYSPDDFLVYAFYGHKREHAAQIAVFRDGATKSRSKSAG